MIVICGVSGVGKTTLGRRLSARLGWRFVDADDFHSPENIRKMSSGRPLTDGDRSAWLSAIRDFCFEKLSGGERIVLACSALKGSYRDVLRIDEHVSFVLLDSDVERVRERLSQRKDHFMDETLLSNQFETLELSDDLLIVDASLSPSACEEEILRQLRLDT